MSIENSEARIAELERKVAVLGNIPELMKTQLALAQGETEARLEMCMTIWKFLIQIKNAQNAMLRFIANSPFVDNADERQKLLDHASRLESACERFEKILGDAGKSEI